MISVHTFEYAIILGWLKSPSIDLNHSFGESFFVGGQATNTFRCHHYCKENKRKFCWSILLSLHVFGRAFCKESPTSTWRNGQPEGTGQLKLGKLMSLINISIIKPESFQYHRIGIQGAVTSSNEDGLFTQSVEFKWFRDKIPSMGHHKQCEIAKMFWKYRSHW